MRNTMDLRDEYTDQDVRYHTYQKMLNNDLTKNVVIGNLTVFDDDVMTKLKITETDGTNHTITIPVKKVGGKWVVVIGETFSGTFNNSTSQLW